MKKLSGVWEVHLWSTLYDSSSDLNVENIKNIYQTWLPLGGCGGMEDLSVIACVASHTYTIKYFKF
jgi:hypothetical protein